MDLKRIIRNYWMKISDPMNKELEDRIWDSIPSKFAASADEWIIAHSQVTGLEIPKDIMAAIVQLKMEENCENISN